MPKIRWIILGCVLVCVSAFRFGEADMEHAKKAFLKQLYVECTRSALPMLYNYDCSALELAYKDVEAMLAPAFATIKSNPVGQDELLADGEKDTETPSTEVLVDQNTEVESTEIISIAPEIDTSIQKKVEINRVKLEDYDYLRQNFFQVDASTTAGKDLLNVKKLLSYDLKIKETGEGPKILIYHTHSQEGYKNTVAGDASTTIVGVGDYLEKLLEEKYGIDVLHHKGVYDLPKRDSAYSKALPELERILKENPSIEVVIDLHRDGVAESTHLVTDIDGKPTAQIMFFNGLSSTTAQGPLKNLENPYKNENLAFSFQMQLAAAEYYPNFARKIYLKGYRYNLHLKPKSILVEVGAQTNSVEEAMNAMEPLSNILGIVLLD